MKYEDMKQIIRLVVRGARYSDVPPFVTSQEAGALVDSFVREMEELRKLRMERSERLASTPEAQAVREERTRRLSKHEDVLTDVPFNWRVFVFRRVRNPRIRRYLYRVWFREMLS